MVPAHERLHSGDRAVRQPDDRLEVEHELLVLDRAPQLGLVVQPIHGRGVHDRIEDPIAHVLVLLRLVHRDVGLLQELLGRRERALGIVHHADPHARPDDNLAAVDPDRLAEGVFDAFGNAHGIVRPSHVVDQHRELVATESGGDIHRSDRAAQPFGDLCEELVPRGVTETVVHVLEAVEIEQQHRGHLLRSQRTRERAAHAVAEQLAVRKSRQRVVESLELVQSPRRDARDAHREDERAVHQRPSPRVRDRVRMVVHAAGIEHADRAVVQDDEGDRAQERGPLLIQGDQRDHHEEMEVKLDHAAGDMDEDGRCGHEAHAYQSGPGLPPEARRAGRHREQQNDRALEGGVEEPEAVHHGERGDPDRVKDQKLTETPVPSGPHLLRERTALGQVLHEGAPQPPDPCGVGVDRVRGRFREVFVCHL